MVGSLNDGRLERGLRQEAAQTRPQTRGGSNEASDKGRLKRGAVGLGIFTNVQTKGSNYKLVNMCTVGYCLSPINYFV